MLPRLLGGAATGQVLARALRGLVEGGRHQEVLGFLLVQMKQIITDKEEQLRSAIAERVREQGGRLVGWALGASIARRVLATLMAELDKITPESSELRDAFDEWTRREIERLETDPARAAEMGAMVRQFVAHEAVQAWMWDVWARLRRTVEADLARPNSHVVGLVEAGFGNLGQVLAQDEQARARLQRGAEAIVAGLLPAARAQLASFIAGVVAHWDTDTVVDRLELRVGKDLQYVRVNGTLVGFLVGGLVYAALRATFGHVSF